MEHFVPSTLTEQLTTNFYYWEIRGRGWQVWKYPVDLEPPFEPFYHYTPKRKVIDDGRTPGISDLISNLFKWGSTTDKKSKSKNNGNNGSSSDPEILYDILPPYPFTDTSPLIEFKVTLQSDQKISPEETQQFLLNLSYCSLPISFEIVGTSEAISILFTCRVGDRIQLKQQLEAYFPQVSIEEQDGFLESYWKKDNHTIIIDFGLSNEFMRTLRTFNSFQIDPLIGIVGALENLYQDELGVCQILFQPVKNPWTESIYRSVVDFEGKAFFLDAPEMVHHAAEKISSPLFSAVIRIVGQSAKYSRAWEIVRQLGSGLTLLANPQSNELIPLSNDGYDDFVHQYTVLARQSMRVGMILNSKELISLVHLPSASVQSKKLRGNLKKSRPAPEIAIGHQMILGTNQHQGKNTTVSLSTQQRLRHTYIIGATGTGKSTLLLSKIVQDIQNGLGVAVLDPHGELIEKILGHIPESRYEDVVLFDPADSDCPVGFNILSVHSEIEKNLLSSDLISAFKGLSSSWGDQMNSVLGNAILAILESKTGGTLVDLRRFIAEKEFRKDFLKTVTDPEIHYYWEKEFPLLSGNKSLGPVLTRLNTFLRPKLIRHIVAQKKGINFEEIINHKKIFLGKLSQGLIGEENSYLLGTMLVSKINQTIMARQAISQEKRQNYYLYIDEFHNFITPSLATMLSGVRKYNLGLILVHQESRQILKRDIEVAHSIMANPATRICFRLGDSDAKTFEGGFSYFQKEDLQNLGIGQAIMRIERADNDFNLTVTPLEDISPETVKEKAEQIIACSRKKHGLPKEEIEKILYGVVSQEEVVEQTIIEQKEKQKVSSKKDNKEILQETSEKKVDASEFKKEFKKDALDNKVGNNKSFDQPEIKEKSEIIFKSKRDPKTEQQKQKKEESQTNRPKEIISTEGKGGAQHRYLQSLIKRIAEDNGFSTTIEQQLSHGLGTVDICLKRDNKRFAVELSVSTSDIQELSNLQKCLTADFEKIILCAEDKNKLEKIKSLVQKKTSKEEQNRIHFFQPEELFSFIEQEAAKSLSTEKRVKGYKVKVNFKPVAEDEKQQKREAISKVIVEAMKRMEKE